MALVPAVTEITSRLSTYDASGIIDAVRDHINADTTHLQIDAYNTGEGLTIGFVDGGESHQVNLRKDGADQIAVSIEPSGSITDPGNSTPTAPTGTSSDWSDEQGHFDHTDGSGTFQSPAKAWIVELKDAFFIVLTDDGNTFQQVICHAGRVYTPINSSDAASNGQDGLGYIVGVPDGISGSGDDWLGNGVNNSRIHWATGEWSEDGVEAPVSGSYVLDSADTAYRPLPPIPIAAIDVDGVSNSEGLVGVTKYLRTAPSNELPRTLVADTGSNQAWMHVNDVNNNEDALIIWDKTVTP